MTAKQRPLIAGNWKMNGLRADGIKLARELARRMDDNAVADFDMLICPPLTLIHEIAGILTDSPIMLGAQDCHTDDNGAHTGDVSAPMLADAGCDFVIVGHSERRSDHGETDKLVKAKAEAALRSGLKVIICIGETEDERTEGRAQDTVKGQLAGSLPDGATSDNTVIAYEPVWAIGSGRTPTTGEVEQIHALIRNQLVKHLGDDEASGVQILYGGSMKPANAGELLALKNVDGGLIGGASLNAEDFWAIGQSWG